VEVVCLLYKDPLKRLCSPFQTFSLSLFREESLAVPRGFNPPPLDKSKTWNFLPPPENLFPFSPPRAASSYHERNPSISSSPFSLLGKIPPPPSFPPPCGPPLLFTSPDDIKDWFSTSRGFFFLSPPPLARKPFFFFFFSYRRPFLLLPGSLLPSR